MATLQELRDLIKGKLDDGDVKRPDSSQIDAQINASIRYYSNKKFWFNSEVVNIPTVIGDKFLTGIPSDYKMNSEPNTLVLVDTSGQKYPLVHIDPLAYDSLDSAGQGRPFWYTYRAGNFELYYIPDQIYTMQLSYIKKYAALVNNNDTNDFTVNAETLIEYKTLEDLLRDYREDAERAAEYARRAKEQLFTILSETYNRTATGNLSTENIIDGGSSSLYYGFY